MIKPIPLDTGVEILELSGEGFGSNKICAFTGVNSTTVRSVILGTHRYYSNELSARQTQRLIREWPVLT